MGLISIIFLHLLRELLQRKIQMYRPASLGQLREWIQNLSFFLKKSHFIHHTESWIVVAQSPHLLGKARRLMYVCSFSKIAVSFFISFCRFIFMALNAAVQREDSHSSSKLGTYEFMFLRVSIMMVLWYFLKKSRKKEHKKSLLGQAIKPI